MLFNDPLMLARATSLTASLFQLDVGLVQTEALDHLSGVIVHSDRSRVNKRLLRDDLHLTLTLLLLELQRNASHRSLLNSLHERCDKSGDLVPQSLRGDNGNLLSDLLVNLEVQSQLLVVSLDDLTSCSLYGLGSYSSHDG